jgi:GNAT superfamily N-acetyltransferase
MTITLRKATAADASAAWEIRNAAIRHACRGFYDDDLLARWTAGEMPEEFAAFVAEHFYVAVVNEKVVGTGAVNLGTGQVDAIFVLPDWMGQGIGRQMIAFLVDRARSAGLAELKLESTLNAAPFYRRCGFVGDVRGTYQSPRGFSLPCYPMTMKIGPR